MRNRTHHVAGRDQTPLPNTKANQNQNSANQTTNTEDRAQRCLSKKKKSPIHKPKPNPVTHGRSRCRRRRRSELVVVVVVAPEGLIVDRHHIDIVGAVDRSAVCASASASMSGARQPRGFLRQSGPPSRFFSLTLSETLNLFLSLSLTE